MSSRPKVRTRSSVQLSNADLDAEVGQALNSLKPLVNALGTMFGPDLEVVLHDLRDPRRSIVTIANGHVTQRQVGGPIIGGPLQDKSLALLTKPGTGSTTLVSYLTRTRDGRHLKSTTIIYHSQATGTPIAALCLNYDLTRLQAGRSALEDLMRVDAPVSAAPGEDVPPLGSADVESVIVDTIDHAVEAIGKPVALMDKDDKARIVAVLDDAGLFMIRSAVERVAQVLGVSRFTIYSYLREKRARS